METCPASGRTQPASSARRYLGHDRLDAAEEAVLADEAEAFSLPVAPGLALELAYDSCGLFAATWRARSWWRAAEIGEA
ncbi:hypothetical protein [Sorangium sp. So ce861]|uniref:hypothetical protein n=1 Tax=Sorangium sp. So ce861 TaxID=3133323 RepID=UPI003F60D767